MDFYTITSVTSVALLGFSYYKGYLNPEVIKQYWNRGKNLYSLIKKLDLDTPKQEIRSYVDINDEGTKITIVYNHYNQSFKLVLPYNRSFVAKMGMFSAELIYGDGRVVDITQQPGIPYIISAADIGGREIRITNRANGNVMIYITPPFYAEELMDDE